MSEYIYNFEYTLNSLAKLHEYLSTNLSGYLYANITENTLDIITSISDQQNTIQNILDDYTNPSDDIIYEKTVICSTEKQVINTNWFLNNTWMEDGLKQLCKIEIISYLQPNTQDDSGDPDFGYSIRIVDSTNNEIIGTITATNNTPEALVINIEEHSCKCTLELQIKKNTPGLCVKISSVVAFYKI